MNRLLQLGADEQAVADHFHYLRSEVSPTFSKAQRAAWDSILGTEYILAVIDVVTEALTVSQPWVNGAGLDEAVGLFQKLADYRTFNDLGHLALYSLKVDRGFVQNMLQ